MILRLHPLICFSTHAVYLVQQFGSQLGRDVLKTRFPSGVIFEKTRFPTGMVKQVPSLLKLAGSLDRAIDSEEKHACSQDFGSRMGGRGSPVIHRPAGCVF